MAFVFNGSSAYLESTTVPVSTYPLTISARFSPSNAGVGANQVIAALCGSTGIHTHQLRLGTLGQIQAVSSEGGTVGQASVGGVTNNLTYTATAIFTSATQRRIFDGANGANDTTNVTPTGLNRLNVGARYDSGALGSFFPGTICDVAIWNAALTDEEAIVLARGTPLMVRPGNLMFYAPLIRPTIDLKGGPSLAATVASVTPHLRARYPGRPKIA